MFRRIHIASCAAAAIWLAGAVAAVDPAAAQSARPLTVEGKRALYQRVIAVPGAGLVESAGDTSGPVQPVTPFTVFYVYARENTGGAQWLQVGLDSAGDLRGWLPAEQAVEWRQTLTVGFKDPERQPRVLLFEERDALNALADQNDVAAYEALRERAVQGDVGDTPVAAIQPEGFIDIRRNFYLVPILSHEDVLVGDYQGRLLQVASVPLEYPAGQDPYRAGIVFVIDTTLSMQPFIERTREIMRGVYEEIEAAGLADRVAYGLVGFRDSTAAVPGLEYVSRVFADLTTSGEEFLSQVGAVRATTVSSQGFNEDPYAGIARAIEEIDWSGHFARYVILITDAGPRLADDPLSGSALGTAELRDTLVERGISPWVIHLKTPSGAANEDHAFAEQEYRELSNVEDIGAFYYPVETGDVADFGAALTAMMEQLTAQVRAAASGFQPLQAGSRLIAGGDEALASFQEKVARLGYALRMDYLKQSAAGDRVPALFNAWMVDRDLNDPSERAVDVLVLLTRDQLSDLHDVLRRILERAEEGAFAPQDFLDELRSLAAIISRDPQAVQAAGARASLAELGYMREYIEGLPYQSEVMNLDLGDWQQWTAQQQFEFINQLDSKVAYYRALHDNLDLWVSLDGGPVDGDSVHPLLLEALP